MYIWPRPTLPCGDHLLFEGKCGDISHYRIRHRDNRFGGAIVISELVVSECIAAKSFVEIQDEGCIGATPSIDILCVVSNNCNARTRMLHGVQEPRLLFINILELINNNISKPANPGATLLSPHPALPADREFIYEIEIADCIWRIESKDLSSQRVESSAPDLRREFWTDEGANPLCHFFRRISGERCKENRFWKNPMVCNKICNPRSNCCCLSGAGRG